MESGRLMWPAAVVLTAASHLWMAATASTDLETLAFTIGFALLILALVFVIWGTVWRARHAEPAPLAPTAAALGFIVAVASAFLWILSRWSQIDDETPIPDWAGDASWGVLLIGSALSAMLLARLAIAVAHRLAPARPDGLTWSACFAMAASLALLLFSWYVVMPDPTSEDLLFFTLPTSLVLAAIAGLAGLIIWIRTEVRRTAGSEAS